MSKPEIRGKVVFFCLKQSQSDNFVGLIFFFLFVLVWFGFFDCLESSTAVRDKDYLWFGSRKFCVNSAEPEDARRLQ